MKCHSHPFLFYCLLGKKFCLLTVFNFNPFSYKLMYEGTSKSFRTLFFKKIFIYVTDMRTTLLFNIISLLLDTFSPAISKLLNAVGKESLWLTAKPVMHRIFHLIISCKSTTS